MSQVFKIVIKLFLVVACLIGAAANSHIWESWQRTAYCGGVPNCLFWGGFWRFFYLGLFFFVLVASIVTLSTIQKRTAIKGRQYLLIGLFAAGTYILASILFFNSYFLVNGNQLTIGDISIDKGIYKEQFFATDIKQVQREWYLSGRRGTTCTTVIKLVLKNNKTFQMEFGSNQQSLEDYFDRSGFSIVNTTRLGNSKRCY